MFHRAKRQASSDFKRSDEGLFETPAAAGHALRVEDFKANGPSPSNATTNALTHR
ncbi:hypothetical protein SAMN05216604_105125 [Pseudomonas agarici]|nr:hypothetical protein SAMN05216604_105125 [Pseudomonas agarici]